MAAGVTRLPRAIVDLEDMTETKNILVFADTGAGKTVLAGQLPGRKLFIAAESGTIAAKRQRARNAKVWHVYHWRDFVAAIEWVENNPTAFDWIIIDSLTTLQEKCMRWVLEELVADKPHRDIDLPDKGEYHKVQRAMKRYIADINELPVHVFWTAQVMRREDEEGDPVVLPMLSGKNYEVSSWACAQMHMVSYMEKRSVKKGREEKVVRRLWFADHPPYVVKDRYDVFPQFIDMSSGRTQYKTAADLISMIDADPRAVKRAQRRVTEVDDSVDVPGETPRVAAGARKAVGKRPTQRARARAV